ncbi:hypothetical protein CGBL_0114420 [Corynebacterium glutamicum]|nr:hypothetical protein CGBL_0114420 [Corynebacterium glutamicum]
MMKIVCWLDIAVYFKVPPEPMPDKTKPERLPTQNPASLKVIAPWQVVFCP